MKTSLYIPNIIKVGYQKREGTYTKQLAYIIYYDEKGKLNIITLKEKETELKQLEKKLESLLSNNKKVELEIDAIAELLK